MSYPGISDTWAAVIAYVVPIVLATLAVLRWFRAGTFIAGGDVGPFVHTSISSEVLSLWGHQITPAGGPGYAIEHAPALLTQGAAAALGLSQELAQQIFYVAAVCSLVASVIYLCRSFGIARTPAAVGGLFAFVNPYVLQTAPNLLPLWAMTIMALSGALVVQAARGRHRSGAALGMISVLGVLLASNPPLLLVVFIWILVMTGISRTVGGPGGCRRTISLLLRSAPWILLLNLWWALPVAFTLLDTVQGSAFSAETDVEAWAWTHTRSSIANVFSLSSTWAWSYPEYFPYASHLDRPAWSFLRFLIPSLALLAPLVTSAHRRLGLTLAAAVVAFVALGKGLHEPLGSINLALYEQVPGFWLLREPASKLSGIMVLVFAVLLGVTLSAVVANARKTRSVHARALLAISITSLAGGLAYPYPIWTGSIIPDDRPRLPSAHVHIPEQWRETASFVNHDPRRGKVLVLPLPDYYQVPTTWGYYGADFIPSRLLTRPSIQQGPGGYFADNPYFSAVVQTIQEKLASGDARPVPRLLRVLGVSHVLLRRDFDYSFPGRQLERPGPLDRTLERVKNLTLAHENTLSKVYWTKGYEPVQTAGSALAASITEPDQLLALLGIAPSSAVVVERKLPFAASAYAIHTDGEPFRFSSTASKFDLWENSSQPQTFAVRLVKLRNTRALWAKPTLRLHVDEREVRPPPATLVPFERRVKGDVFINHQLVPHKGRQLVLALAPETPLTALGSTSQSGRDLTFTGPSDCNSFDDRTMKQVGISAQRLSGEPQPAWELRAEDHSACMSAPVERFTPGASYEVAFDYRNLGGNAARLCLWEEGPDKCADLPTLERSRSWQHYAASPTIDQGTTGLRLFLYADGKSREPTITQYRGVSVQLRHGAHLTLVERRPTNPAPTIGWAQDDASSYRVRVASSDDPFFLILNESFNPGWEIQGLPSGRSARHLKANGFANAWLISPGPAATVSLRYGPTMLATISQQLSLLSLWVAIAVLTRPKRLAVRRVFRRDHRGFSRRKLPAPGGQWLPTNQKGSV